MELERYLKKNHISVYWLSKESGIPYTTLSNLAKGRSDPKECRVGTLLKLSEILGTSIDSLVTMEVDEHHFIDDSVLLNTNTLPKPLRDDIKELEIFDREEDTSFFSMADTMLLTADRMLSSGAIDKEIYAKLYAKYPLEK